MTLSTFTHAESVEIWNDSFTPALLVTKSSVVTQKNDAFYYTKEIPVIALQSLIDSKQSLQNRSDREQRSQRLGKPLRAGIKRSISATSTVEKLESYLDWQTLEDGSHVAAITIISPQAVGSRLILNIEKLNPRAELRFSDNAGDEIFTVPGEEVINTVFTNNKEIVDTDTDTDTDEVNNLYVGPYLKGEQATLEIFLPSDVSVGDIQLALPYLSHIFIAPNKSDQLNPGNNQSCMRNSVCDSSMLRLSNSSAKMLYTDKSGDSYICTGTLINDTQNSGIPYFLTANHCINTPQDASSLQTFWFYNAESCESDNAVSDYQQLTKGADLLFNHASTDTALLRLNEAVPAGVTFAGWTTDSAKTSETYVFHHPNGQPKKIARGITDSSYANCQGTKTDGFMCNPLNTEDAGFLTVTYNSSATAGGSSGAGLFISKVNPSVSSGASESYYIAGQLYGGNTSCDVSTGHDAYGRFDLAFNAGLKTWLKIDKPVESPSSKSAIFRFYSTKSKTHFFTNSEKERDSVISKYASFIYEGEGFYAYDKAGVSLNPVYRFFHKVRGSHFYTISKTEKENVEVKYPNYIYEGVAWYAAPTPVPGGKPLYRFYNTKTGTHFYTVNAEEKDNIIIKYESYIYEGIAYYVWLNKE